jgi:hypothetical protein
MTEIDRRSLEWAQRYRELLEGYIEAMGGKSITPIRRVLAENLATLGAELSALTDRFLASGRGGNAEDLQLYLKLSGVIADLLREAGLSLAKQSAIIDPPGESARAKLEAIIGGLIDQRRAEESKGVYRDSNGDIITPDRLIPIPSPAPSTSPAPAAPPAPRLVVNKVAPPPAPSSTTLFYQWEAAGGGSGISSMGPDPSWPRLR